jgi:hypothetical protein
MTPPRRKLSAVDDPLFATPAAEPRVVARRPAPEPEKTSALYVELPQEQWDTLARAAFEVRAHKRRIIAALIARHVDTSPEGLEALRVLLDADSRRSP